MATKTIKTGIGQSLINIAVQEYGCYEGVFLLLDDNPTIVSSLSHVFAPGTSVVIQNPVPQLTDNNVMVAAKLQNKGVKVSGNHPPTDPPPPITIYQSGVYENNIYQ